MRRASSSTARSASSSAATRRSRSGTGGSTTPAGIPTSLVQRVLQAAARAGALALGVVAAPALAASPGRVHRRAAHRLRARPDPLVVPLPAVVLPVRRAALIAPLPATRRRAEQARAASRRMTMLGRRRLSPDGGSLARPRPPRCSSSAWGLVHRGFWAHGQLIDTPVVPELRRRDRAHGHRSLPRLPGRVPAGRAPRVRAALADRRLRATFGWLMAACGVALVLRRRLAARAGGVVRRASRRCWSAR